MKHALGIALLVAVAWVGSATRAAATTIPVCPAAGADTGCEVLFTRNADGSFTTAPLSGEGPYDAVEDTLYGIINNGPDPLFAVTLSGIPGLFGFDGDGACSGVGFSNPHPACSGGDATGYGGFVSANQLPVLSGAGNRVFFSNIGPGNSSGVVNFTGGIPVGGSAWFSLEETVGLTGPPVIGGPTAVPEPATLGLLGLGLVGLRRLRRRESRSRNS